MAINAKTHTSNELLDEMTEVAVRMDLLLARIKEHRNVDPAPLQRVIQKLACQFEALYQRAIHRDIPLDTPMITRDQRGTCYEISLTHEGMDYRVV